MKQKSFFVFAILIFLISCSAVFADANDTATVEVNVAEVAQITVMPDLLTWSAVLPGYAGEPKLLDIKNTGSKNVTNIYAYVDTLEDEATRPYGFDDPLRYAAGGVIVFKNETYDKFFFAGRLEWNWTEDISNMQKTGVTSPVAWGFFKNTTYEYNWLVGNGTGGFCNNTGAEFAISDYPDNGTVETRTPSDASITFQQGVDWGYFSINRATSPLYGSCVAAYYDCSKIYIYKYDKRSGFASCGNSEYIQAPNLVPGETHTLTLNVYIPLGIPAGNLNTAIFTVSAG